MGSSSPSTVSRRSIFAGFGAAGAVAAVASLVPATPKDMAGAEPAPSRPAPPRGGGYQLSEHVKQYYKTTRI